ncbi:uncharacterized protein ARMOST_18172 [Armillaria ostoyae]|uniref:Uncharacterized protein n=1 Tax=Armillaria ostoyae TaxID=47428 RepID=A0A284S166_ARMOS|nr:uncharacterized protein ARMOST_18172 [Armillaria ostoyae]
MAIIDVVVLEGNVALHGMTTDDVDRLPLRTRSFWPTWLPIAGTFTLHALHPCCSPPNPRIGRYPAVPSIQNEEMDWPIAVNARSNLQFALFTHNHQRSEIPRLFGWATFKISTESATPAKISGRNYPCPHCLEGQTSQVDKIYTEEWLPVCLTSYDAPASESRKICWLEHFLISLSKSSTLLVAHFMESNGPSLVYA